MVNVSKKNKVAAGAEANMIKRSRNCGHMRRRKLYQLNLEDHQLVQQLASCETLVSTDPPPTPRRLQWNWPAIFISVQKREAEFHYSILEQKDGGVWLHLQFDDMNYCNFGLPDSGSLIEEPGLSAGDTVMLFKDDQLGSYDLLRARRDAMRLLTHPTTHNPVRLPPGLPYDPLQDFGVESFVVPRVLEYNYQTTDNIAVDVDVMDESHSTDNLEGVQAEKDHQTTVYQNNNIDVAVAPVEEDLQTTVNESNNVGMAEVMQGHQTTNANNYVSDSVDVANEMIFPSLDDHNSFTLASLLLLPGSDNHGSSYEFAYPIDDSWEVGVDHMDFDFISFLLPK